MPCDAGWRWASPVPQGFDLSGVAYAGTLGTFVAVGRAGTIQTSSDGVAWSPLDLGLTDDLHDVAFGNGTVVAVGKRIVTNSPLLLTSRDGAVWEVRDTAEHALTSGALTTVEWDGTEFIALDENGTVWTSVDGEQWPARGVPIANIPWFRPNELAWTGTELIAVGYGKVTIPGETGGIVLTSRDSLTWTAALFASGCRFASLASSTATLVVVGTNGMVAARTADAWSSKTLDVDFTGVVWTGDRFLATGAGKAVPHEPKTYESLDGKEWVQADIPALSRIHAFTSGGERRVAVGEHGACATSADGRAWRELDRTLAASFQAVAWIGDSFLAVGDDGAMAASRDGAAWLEKAPVTDEHLHDIVWNGERVLVIGNAGTALVSGDGESWESEATGTSIPLLSAVWDGSRFVVAGGDLESGYIVLSSPDGIRWQRLSDETTPPIRRLVWTGTAFVGIGRGEIHASPDAVHWTPIPIDNAPCFHPLATVPAAAASGGQLVVVLTHDALCDVAGACTSRPLVSGDGLEWRCGDPIPLAFSVAFDGSQFIAAGEDGTISTSPDGITWTTERGRGSASATLFGIASSPRTSVAVGIEGTVMVRECQRLLIPRSRVPRS